MFRTWWTVLAVISSTAPAWGADWTDDPINPLPRPVLTTPLKQWDFTDGTGGWVAENQCTVASDAGRLVIESSGNDPFLHCPVDLPGGQLALKLRLRSRQATAGGVFWTTDRSPTRGEDKQVHFPLTADGEWHEYVARFTAPES